MGPSEWRMGWSRAAGERRVASATLGLTIQRNGAVTEVCRAVSRLARRKSSDGGRIGVWRASFFAEFDAQWGAGGSENRWLLLCFDPPAEFAGYPFLPASACFARPRAMM